MTGSRDTRGTTYAGLDLEQAPGSYHRHPGAVLASVNGTHRREQIRRLMAGEIRDLPPLFFRDALFERELDDLGIRHGHDRLGEQLPACRTREVEFARLTYLRRWNPCVWSFRARAGIPVSLTVCASDGSPVEPPCDRLSIVPSLRALTDVIDLTRTPAFPHGLFPSLWTDAARRAADRADPVGAVRLESAFYPDLGELYDRRGRAWTDGGSAVLPAPHGGLDGVAPLPPRPAGPGVCPWCGSECGCAHLLALFDAGALPGVDDDGVCGLYPMLGEFHDRGILLEAVVRRLAHRLAFGERPDGGGLGGAPGDAWRGLARELRDVTDGWEAIDLIEDPGWMEGIDPETVRGLLWALVQDAAPGEILEEWSDSQSMDGKTTEFITWRHPLAAEAAEAACERLARLIESLAREG